MTCELCQEEKRVARVQVSTYDPAAKEWLERLHTEVCAGCVDLLSPVVSAAVQSWYKGGRGRVAKLKNVKV